MDSRQVARSLAWFGIGLGLVETLSPGALGKASGLSRHKATIRLFGLREIASGVLVLAAKDPAKWLWVRVAGDGLDAALLAEGLRADNPDRERTVLATLAVAPVVVLDMLHAYRAGV